MRTILFITLFAFFTGISSFAQGKIVYGIMRDTLGNTYFASVNLSKAEVTKISPSVLTPAAGGYTSTINPYKKEFYVLSEVLSDIHIVTIDISTGEVINSVKISNPKITNPNDNFSIIGFQFHCKDSLIYGVARIVNDYFLATIDPVTGIITNISTKSISDPNLLSYGINGLRIDLDKKIYYHLGQHKIIGIDMTTGEVKSDTTDEWGSVGHLRYNPLDKKFYDIVRRSVPNLPYLLCSIDPVTGAITQISPSDIKVGNGGGGGFLEIMDYKRKYYYYNAFVSNVTNAQVLVKVDMVSGTIISTKKLTFPWNDPNLLIESVIDPNYDCVMFDETDEDDSTETTNTAIEFPTVFTPNNDGINDDFKPIKFQGVEAAKLVIYSRWGQKLFETADIKTGWDGQYNGKRCADGTYYWILNYTNSEKEIKAEKGFLTLLK